MLGSGPSALPDLATSRDRDGRIRTFDSRLRLRSGIPGTCCERAPDDDLVTIGLARAPTPVWHGCKLRRRRRQIRDHVSIVNTYLASTDKQKRAAVGRSPAAPWNVRSRAYERLRDMLRGVEVARARLPEVDRADVSAGAIGQRNEAKALSTRRERRRLSGVRRRRPAQVFVCLPGSRDAEMSSSVWNRSTSAPQCGAGRSRTFCSLVSRRWLLPRDAVVADAVERRSREDDRPNVRTGAGLNGGFQPAGEYRYGIIRRSSMTYYVTAQRRKRSLSSPNRFIQRWICVRALPDTRATALMLPPWVTSSASSSSRRCSSAADKR